MNIQPYTSHRQRPLVPQQQKATQYDSQDSQRTTTQKGQPIRSRQPHQTSGTAYPLLDSILRTNKITGAFPQSGTETNVRKLMEGNGLDVTTLEKLSDFLYADHPKWGSQPHHQNHLSEDKKEQVSVAKEQFKSIVDELVKHGVSSRHPAIINLGKALLDREHAINQEHLNNTEQPHLVKARKDAQQSTFDALKSKHDPQDISDIRRQFNKHLEKAEEAFDQWKSLENDSTADPIEVAKSEGRFRGHYQHLQEMRREYYKQEKGYKDTKKELDSVDLTQLSSKDLQARSWDIQRKIKEERDKIESTKSSLTEKHGEQFSAEVDAAAMREIGKAEGAIEAYEKHLIDINNAAVDKGALFGKDFSDRLLEEGFSKLPDVNSPYHDAVEAPIPGTNLYLTIYPPLGKEDAGALVTIGIPWQFSSNPFFNQTVNRITPNMGAVEVMEAIQEAVLEKADKNHPIYRGLESMLETIRS